MSTLEQLLGHDPTVDTRTDYIHTIETGIRTQPRSLQRTIGPSELGTDCTHCLAAKLAHWEQTERDVAWLPFIGTGVHAELARIFDSANTSLARSRWIVERRLYVGMIGPHAIHGSCDLYDQATGTVIDHKIVGAETLRTAKAGPREVYRVQAHLYGLGWENAGHCPERVMIAHLPRNAVSLAQAVIWTEAYDPTVAYQALERANRVHANLTALTAISLETRDEWIHGLERAPGCFSCRRYPDWATTPEPSRLSLEFGITTSSTDRKAA